MASRHQSKRMLSVFLSSIAMAAVIFSYFKWMMVSNEGDAFEAGDSQSQQSLSPALERALEVDEKGLSKAVATLQTTRGKIRFRFYTKDAPKTVHRIAHLIETGFYNGLVFHRVEPGFIIQGGDPTGTGSGGSGELLQAEFNTRKHAIGAVAMARKWEDPDSADSQFYITLGNQFELDGKYTVFGQVIEGLDVIQQIQVGDRMTAVTLEDQ